MDEKEFEKVRIYPKTRFVPVDTRTGQDHKLVPEKFLWKTKSGVRRVTVNRVESVMRAPALKAGGHGYRYTCYVSWVSKGETFTQLSHLWFDHRRLEWFVECPVGEIPVDWDTESQVLPEDEDWENMC